MLGKFTDTLTRGNKSVSEEIFVVRGLQRCLLGRPAIFKFDFVKFNSLDEVFTHEAVKQAHPGLFKEIGSLAGEYKIALKEEISSFALSVPRRVAIQLLPKVKLDLERMESRYNFASRGADRLVFGYGGSSESQRKCKNLCPLHQRERGARKFPYASY